MASTEPRAGFRPPWALNVDAEDPTDAVPVRGDAESSGEGPQEAAPLETSAIAEPAVEMAGPTAEASGDEAESRSDAETAVSDDAPLAGADTPGQPTSASPTKFQVDLARAMRAAAETARAEAMERLGAESQAKVEAIRAQSTDAAAELRKRADDDIAEIRDWSKGELARIRAETEAKISDRKSWLEHEIEAHDESIEVLVSAVTSRVSAFEAELEAFFGRLSEEDDPTRIAVLAQSLPDVPSLDDDAAMEAAQAVAAVAAVAEPADSQGATVADGMTPAVEPAAAAANVEAATDDDSTSEAVGAIETVPESAPALDPWADAPGWGAPIATQDETSDDADPTESFGSVERRLAAFGLDAGFAGAAAEAEPATDVAWEPTVDAETEVSSSADPEATGSDPDAQADADERPNAEAHDAVDASTSPIETSVVVDGLISVASIAGFKRHLSRVDGVHAVTVSSGPDGEFIFAVRHDESARLEEILPAMAGFGARVTGTADGTISVTAHDPENASEDAVLDPATR